VSSLLQRLSALALLGAAPALAHDRHGNAAMNQDVHVLIDKDHIEVTFTLDTNDEGTIVEAIAMDANGDGKLSPEEQSAYFAQLDARLREGLQIVFDGKDVPLSPSAHVDLAPPSRKTFHFQGKLGHGSKPPVMIAAHNDNFLDWPGRAKLTMDPSDDLRKSVDLQNSSPTGDTSVLLLFEHGSPRNPGIVTLDWGEWSWPRVLLAPLSIELGAAVLLLIACILMLVGRPSTVRRVAGASLIAASLAGIAFVFSKPQKGPVPPETWQAEFLVFHDRLSAALAQYHQDGDASSLSPFASPDVIRKLTKATRVADPRDDKAGVFELRRARSIATTLLDTPRLPFQPALRIHHEWRAIGLMRHEGHPHERVRDFACDYTLRVTGHGFLLIDCSEWNQLPDEPLE
jgi:hypothetical protein